MHIKKYDFYKFGYEKYFLDIRYEDNENLPFCITNLFHELYPKESAEWYKHLVMQPEAFSKIGRFPGVEVTLEQKNNLIYISDAYEDDYRIRTKDVTVEMIIQFCHNGRIDYSVMTYDNFIALISSWTNLIEHEPPFALLYRNEHQWYDVLPFEAEETMRQFVADYLQK